MHTSPLHGDTSPLTDTTTSATDSTQATTTLSAGASKHPQPGATLAGLMKTPDLARAIVKHLDAPSRLNLCAVLPNMEPYLQPELESAAITVQAPPLEHTVEFSTALMHVHQLPLAFQEEPMEAIFKRLNDLHQRHLQELVYGVQQHALANMIDAARDE
jgi:hypothetical protein